MTEQKQIDHQTTTSSELENLGEAFADQPYPALALDIEGSDYWSRMDRMLGRVSGWLNPILVKEARQSLKSRQFIITFLILLLASFVWTIFGVAMNAPDVFYLPTGKNLLSGYYFILAIPLLGIVPLAAYRSLAAEIENDTFEMLVITRLSSMRIVIGKLNSALLQMMLYFAAVVPCLVFCYLLRGVTFGSILILIELVGVNAMVLTSLAILLATLVPNRVGQTMVLLMLIVAILVAESVSAVFCLGLIYDEFYDESEWFQMLAVYTLMSASCIVIMIKAAASRIAPITENRSTGLRWCMFAQQLLWVAVISAMAISSKDASVLNFGTMIVGGYWLLMGTLSLAESPELSPRVQRGLPSTLAGRALFTWFNPGPGTGYVFAIASGTAGAFALGCFGELVGITNGPRTNGVLFAFLIVGYLWFYLGLTRLISIPFCRLFGGRLWVVCAIAITVMVSALLLAIILDAIFIGPSALDSLVIEPMNWAQSIERGFYPVRFNTTLPILVFIVGSLITLINLTLLFREFEYRRVAVPQRVVDDVGKAS